jgi:hypothetical protein
VGSIAARVKRLPARRKRQSRHHDFGEAGDMALDLVRRCAEIMPAATTESDSAFVQMIAKVADDQSQARLRGQIIANSL